MLLKSNENREKDTEDKLSYCDSELVCIRKDLNNFNQVNKDFLEVVKRTMGSFDESINGVKSDLEFKLKEFRCEKKNSDWSLKMDIEAKLDKFECSVEATNNKVSTDCQKIGSLFCFSFSQMRAKKYGRLGDLLSLTQTFSSNVIYFRQLSWSTTPKMSFEKPKNIFCVFYTLPAFGIDRYVRRRSRPNLGDGEVLEKQSNFPWCSLR